MNVSIITATYNSGATVKDTIVSVLSQNYPNIEYIIIDGDSKDDTLNIVRQYEPLFNGRMKWISEKDNGIYDAMNKGIRLATGDVVGILNSDDFFRSNDVIANIAEEFIKDETLDCTIADLCFIDNNDKKKIVRYYSAKGWKPSYLRWGLEPPHPTFYCKKSVYNRLGLYKLTYKIGADYELLTRYLLAGRIKYKYIPMNMVCMRLGGVSTGGLKNVLIVNNIEAVRACRENGIYTNIFFIFFKYFNKIKGYLFRTKNN